MGLDHTECKLLLVLVNKYHEQIIIFQHSELFSQSWRALYGLTSRFNCLLISQMSEIVSSYGVYASVRHHRTWSVSMLHAD